ncbi:MAG: helix-turn-helix transcriptional regulator [bacterium]|nr:helix-turn-helix transcriptional regulator [bacterium]
MEVQKFAYFYFKLEHELNTSYPQGYERWYFDYFKECAHVCDSSGKDVTADIDTVYIVPPGTPMYFKYHGIESFIHTCILFDAEMKFMNSLDIPFMTPIKIIHVSEFERLLFEMQERQLSSSRFSQDEQDAYLKLILMFIHDEIHEYEHLYYIKRGDDLQSLRNTVMNSLATPWTIHSMAQRVNMSVSTFQRQYKKNYGKTPIADLYDMRFKKSKELLENGYSIPWVLNSCCFKSFQHFSRFFKARSGMTPSEFKAKQNIRK